MKATVILEFEINDSDFDDESQKKLFYESSFDSQKEWLKNKAFEKIEDVTSNDDFIVYNFKL